MREKTCVRYHEIYRLMGRRRRARARVAGAELFDVVRACGPRESFDCVASRRAPIRAGN